MPRSNNFKDLRTALIDGFSPEDLRQFCFDTPSFRRVHNNLTQHTGNAEIVNYLLEHTQHRLLLDELLAFIKEKNPKRYIRHNLEQYEHHPGLDDPIFDESNPYRGLLAFREEDEQFFFGRESFTTQLIEKVQQKSVVAVLGPSGSGKSSVVFAGLIPYLRRNHWLLPIFRPGNDPFRALVRVLMPLLAPALSEIDQLKEIPDLADGLTQGKYDLSEMIVSILQKNPTTHLLMVVDQFEELYTLCDEPRTQIHFLNSLLALGNNQQRLISGQKTNLVLTLRADFLDQASRYGPFVDAIQESNLILRPMTLEELRQVIELPAQIRHASFAEGLVERILKDVGEEPGNLPLLEFALQQLWKKQTNGQLTHQGYQDIGRVNGALTSYADEKYAELSQSEQDQTRRILVQLVKPGVGTRKLATRTDLANWANSEKDTWLLVKHLADARLVVTDRNLEGSETVEIVHEALIREWEQLSGWVEADNSFRTWQEQLKPALYQWEKSNKDSSALLHGLSLDNAKDWFQKREADLSQDEQEFINKSIIHRNREKNQQLAVISAIVVLVFLALGTWVVGQNQLTKQERIAAQRASAKSLAALGPRTDDDELTALLSIEGFRINTEAKGDGQWVIDDTLRQLLSKPHFSTILRGHTKWIWSVAFSPDGQTLASASGDQTIRLWNLRQPEVEPIILRGHTSEVWSVAFSPDGKTLASAGEDQTVRLWDLYNLQAEPQVLFGHEARVLFVVFSPDGQTLASASDDQTVRLWNMHDLKANPQILNDDEPRIPWEGSPDGQVVAFSPNNQTLAWASAGQIIRLWDLHDLKSKPRILPGHEGRVYSLTFSPDSQTLASAGEDQIIRLWDLHHPDATPQILQGHEKWIWSVAFSPDGQTLASASDDQTVRLWDLKKLGTEPKILRGHETRVLYLAFSPDGHILASADDRYEVRLWDLVSTKAAPQILRGHEGWVRSVSLSSDGHTLASGSNDKTIRLWDLHHPDATPQILQGHEKWIWSVAFSPNGQTLASASEDETVQLWDLSQSQPKAKGQPLRGHTGFVLSVAFSPNGQTLASASKDKTIRLWDLTKPEPIQKALLTGHEDAVGAVTFSPDGQTLASASDDFTIQLWDLTQSEPKQKTLLTGHTAAVRSVAFSPDGQILASASQDHTVRLWDLNNPEAKPRILRGHENNVLFVTFSPDGQTLASASSDQTIRLWDMTQPEAPPRVLSGHTAEVWAVAFSPDGKTLVSASTDTTIRVWIVPLDRLVELGCQLVRRNLSLMEWSQYLGDEPYHKTCPNLPIHSSLIEVGRDLAKVGDINSAIRQFQKILELEPNLDLDPQIEANRARAQGLIMEGGKLAQKGIITEAITAYTQAQTLDPTVKIPADFLNSLCWCGSLWGHATEVLSTCEQAVELLPINVDVHDNRGLARALAGDYIGAINDFQFVVDWLKKNNLYEQYGRQREEWINELKVGRNPFDEETLKQIRNESCVSPK